MPPLSSPLSAFQRRALAASASVGVVLVMLAGADFPPPPGFAWLLLPALFWGAVVYVRAPVHARWCVDRRPRRLTRIALEGMVAGLAIALAFVGVMALQPGHFPAVPALLAWLAALGAAGMVGLVGVYSVVVLLMRRPASGAPRS